MYSNLANLVLCMYTRHDSATRSSATQFSLKNKVTLFQRTILSLDCSIYPVMLSYVSNKLVISRVNKLFYISIFLRVSHNYCKNKVTSGWSSLSIMKIGQELINRIIFVTLFLQFSDFSFASDFSLLHSINSMNHFPEMR